MTSDAKIGLLLGLVFIFIISFLVNGLPSFSKGGGNNELTGTMVGFQKNAPGIGTREREVINLSEPVKKQAPLVARRPVSKPDIRFRTELPKRTPVVKETKKAVEIKPSKPSKAIKPTLPKTYVVSDGDNLAVIAEKLYGSEDGKRTLNVTRIFDANRKLLASPDEIYPGQRLIIPPLSSSAAGKNTIGTILEKVKSIGQRHLSTTGRGAEQIRWYVVREGDSLWLIAAEQLGEGSRYEEIAKLNANILDEDSLVVGMRLRIPAR